MSLEELCVYGIKELVFSNIQINQSDYSISTISTKRYKIIRALHSEFRRDSSVLRTLDLSHNTAGLGLTKPEVLAEAVISLHCVNLKMISLTEAQASSLLSAMASSSRSE